MTGILSILGFINALLVAPAAGPVAHRFQSSDYAPFRGNFVVEDMPGSFQTLPRYVREGEVNAAEGLLVIVWLSSAAPPEYPVILLSISDWRFRK